METRDGNDSSYKKIKTNANTQDETPPSLQLPSGDSETSNGNHSASKDIPSDPKTPDEISPSLHLHSGEMETASGNSSSALADDFIRVPVQSMYDDSLHSTVNIKDTATLPADSSTASESEDEFRLVVSLNDTATVSAHSSTSSRDEDALQHVVSLNDTATLSADSSTSSENEDESPSLHLLRERRRYYYVCLHLYKAAVEGNVNEGRRLIRNYPRSLGAAVTEGYQTVLHVAAGGKQTRFLEEMMNLEQPINLRLKDKLNFTAFCYAAMAGSKEIAEIMLRNDPELLKIRGGLGIKRMTPLFLAVSFGQREMASFLYFEMKEKARRVLEEDRADIFFQSIDTTSYDLALKLLKDDEENKLATGEYDYDDTKVTPLHRLAQTPLHLLSKNDKTPVFKQALELIQLLWEKILDKEDTQVWKYFYNNRQLLFVAARLGNYEFLAKLIGLFPDLVRLQDENGQSIFHIAIDLRHRNLFSLIYEIGFNKQLIASYLDNDGNSLLHLAAKYPNHEKPDQIRVPDAALELERELKIFEEVELLVQPSYKELKNSDHQTPREVFADKHAPLLKQGEEWTRKTADSCMLVATLITTVVFATAFSIPGGNDQVKGIPILLRRPLFTIFSIVDAIALSASTISILMFWSILVSPYVENNFLRSLLTRLVLGLLMLFISTASMLVSFGSSFFLAYSQGISIRTPAIIAVVVGIPVIVFVFLKVILLKKLFLSSLRYRFSTKPKKR